MTSGKMYLVAALCPLVLLSTIISSTESASCCLRYTNRRLPCKKILEYSVQTMTGSCDINAIIFHIPGRFVCADPVTRWTQMGKKCVDNRRRMAARILSEAAPYDVTSSLVNASRSSSSA